MADLLSVIRRQDEDAANVLQKVGVRSDWDLKIVTREDLAELFEGPDQFQRRGKIFGLINKQKPEELLEEVEKCISGKCSKDGCQVLVDYIHTLKDQKVHMEKFLEFHDACIKFLVKIVQKNTPQWNSEKAYPTMEVKSGLLSEIEKEDKEAAQVLERAGFQTDCKLKTLTPEHLRELFQGSNQLQRRGKIYKIINKLKPVSELMTEVKNFFPEGRLKVALTDNEVLVDWLHILKDQRVYMKDIQEFNDAHISWLESIRAPQAESVKASCATNNDQIDGRNPSTVHDAVSAYVPTAASACQDQHLTGQKDFVEVSHQDVLKDSARYKMVVSGKTFGTHQVILDRLKEQVQLAESRDGHQITIVFCAISTRVGSDVDAALADVKDDKPIILVLMHHSREPTVTTSVRTWAHDDNDANVILHVDVFYHETSGLLKCQQNYDAFSVIQNKLVATFPKSHVQGNPPPKKGRKDSESGKDNDKSGGGVRSWFSEKTSQLPKPW